MKIIKVTDDEVLIGISEQDVVKIPKSSIDFEAKVGMEVERYTSNGETFFVPKQSIITPSDTAQNADNVAQEGRKVNKILYILMAFFFGGIGVHKFLIGRVGTGILFIIFSWTGIPSIIAFVDFIIGCCKQPDKNGDIYFA